MKRYEQQVIALHEAVEEIKRRKKVSDEEYNELQFEIGCLFVEHFSGGDKELCNMLLTEKEAGYWTWWRARWRLDDRNMLKYSDAISYSEAKMSMIGSSVEETSLYGYLEFKGIIKW